MAEKKTGRTLGIGRMRRGIQTDRTGIQGFTLIELMVVVVLIAIVTAVIIPEMKGTYEDALLRSTSRKLVSAFSLAYSQAVTANQLHRVRLDKRKGRYVVEKRASEGGAGFVPVKDLPGCEGELDSRISIEIRKPGAEPKAGPVDEARSDPAEDQPSQGAADVLVFNADGTAEDREIILKDREGFRLALRINPTTARTRIIEMERE